MRKISFLTLLLIALLVPRSAEGARGAVVIKKSNGEVKSACVDFEGESISGWKLLESSPFSPIAKNGFIVEIDGEGGKDSSEMGDGEHFWSYWRLSDNWIFQNAGATYTRVKDGDVEGWEFGKGSSSLPKIQFNDICISKKVIPLSDEKSNPLQISETNESVESFSEVSSEIEESPALMALDKSIDSRHLIEEEGEETAEKPVEKDEDIETNEGGSVKAALSDRSRVVDFNLENFLLLFFTIAFASIMFILIKFLASKYLKSRRSKRAKG